MQNAVSAFIIATFGAQLIGMALAGSAAAIGPAPLFVVQSLATLASVLVLVRIPRLPPRPPATTRHRTDLARGLAYAFGAPPVRAVLIAMFGVGVLYIGAWIVLVPLIIRDVHHGDAAAFSAINVCFWGGSVITNLVLMRRRPIVRRGRALLIALANGAIIMALMGLDISFAAFCGLCFLWGLGSGVSLSMGRTIVQEVTPAALRGRTLALFQLGFIGGAPVGALIFGIVGGRLGAQTAMFVPAAAAGLLIAAMALFSVLPRIRAGGQAVAGSYS
jgi:MFS family permease